MCDAGDAVGPRLDVVSSGIGSVVSAVEHSSLKVRLGTEGSRYGYCATLGNGCGALNSRALRDRRSESRARQRRFGVPFAGRDGEICGVRDATSVGAESFGRVPAFVSSGNFSSVLVTTS
jgi:hypothetical protein